MRMISDVDPLSTADDTQMSPKGGHFLQDDIARFDNSFFRISDTEAKVSIRMLGSLSERSILLTLC